MLTQLCYDALCYANTITFHYDIKYANVITFCYVIPLCQYKYITL